MDAQAFARACREERDAMLASYSDPDGNTEVSALIVRASLTAEQRSQVLAALDTALTDAFYTLLLALDGAASLGGEQQLYTLLDQSGNVVTAGSGSLEAAAWEAMQANRL